MNGQEVRSDVVAKELLMKATGDFSVTMWVPDASDVDTYDVTLPSQEVVEPSGQPQPSDHAAGGGDDVVSYYRDMNE